MREGVRESIEKYARIFEFAASERKNIFNNYVNATRGIVKLDLVEKYCVFKDLYEQI